MSIDWITVAAQILNFLVLLWLLKRFLYRPILDGIDAREREIADRLSQAVDARVRAEEAAERSRQSAVRLERDREAVLAAARDTADAERKTLLDDLRERLDRERESSKAARADDARRYAAELQRSGADTLLTLLRRALTDLADETFEQRLVSHVASQAAESSEALRRAAGAEGVGTVTTRESLSSEARKELETTLGEVLPGVELHYRTDPARSPGIVLQVGSARLDWSVDRYVDGLEVQLEQVSTVRSGGDLQECAGVA